MARLYVLYHPAKQIEPPTWTKNLFSLATTLVYVRVDSHRSPLQPVDLGPYKRLAKFFMYFKLDMRHGINNVSIDRIKTAHLPSISCPVVITTRDRIVRHLAKFATTVCNVVVFCFLVCTVHIVCFL